MWVNSRCLVFARYNLFMRSFSLLFTFISVVVLTMFLIYVIRGPVDPIIAAGLFVSFLFCVIPTIFLLKPFEDREALQRRREEWKKRRDTTGGGPEDRGS